MQPIIPAFSAEIQKQLNLKKLTWNDLNFKLKNHKKNSAKILIAKLEEIVVERKIKQIDFTVSKEVNNLGVKVRIAQINNLTTKHYF